jgi:hypothetical protein
MQETRRAGRSTHRDRISIQIHRVISTLKLPKTLFWHNKNGVPPLTVGIAQKTATVPGSALPVTSQP